MWITHVGGKFRHCLLEKSLIRGYSWPSKILRVSDAWIVVDLTGMPAQLQGFSKVAWSSRNLCCHHPARCSCNEWAKKAHKLTVFNSVKLFCRPSSRGLSLGLTGLPLCKIRRKPRFVPRTFPGSSQEQPDQKVYVYVPFSCLINEWQTHCSYGAESKWAAEARDFH